MNKKNMEKVSITEADLENPDDAAALLHLVNRYAADPMGRGRELDKEVRERLIGELRQFPGAFAFLARLEGKPVGVAVCFYGFSTFHGARLINIHDLGVLEEYRGRGIGRALLKKVEQKARESGCCKLTLEVREDNPASRLYERAGFRLGDPMFWFMTLETST
ncbi:MAG: GNAT family N-acetyltransferase [Balneolaceae bacterium]